MLVILNEKSMAKKMITPKTQRLTTRKKIIYNKKPHKNNLFLNFFYTNYQFSKASSKQTIFYKKKLKLKKKIVHPFIQKYVVFS